MGLNAIIGKTQTIIIFSGTLSSLLFSKVSDYASYLCFASFKKNLSIGSQPFCDEIIC